MKMLTGPGARLLPGALVLPILLAFAAPLGGPRFAPEEGATVTKSFETVSELTLDELSLIVNGSDVSGEIGMFEIAFRNEQTVEVTDVYGVIANGRPVKLERTYDEISSAVSFEVFHEMGDESTDMPSTSEIEGESVVFTWNEENGEYDVAFAGDEEGEGDKKLLENLAEDMDLRAFLPGEDVSEGDTWKIELDQIATLMLPGGDLKLRPEENVDVDVEMFEALFEDDFSSVLDDLLTGKCECEFAGQSEVDGVAIAEIEIEIEIASNVDFSEILAAIFDIMAEQTGEVPELLIEVADVDLDLEATGTLMWNLEAGVFQSFEMTGDMTIALEIAISGEVEAEISVELSGTIEEQATAEG